MAKQLRWIVVAGALVALPRTAQADPIELVDKRQNYWLFDDTSGAVEFGNFFTRDPFYVAYNDIEGGFLAVHPDDSQFLVVYTTWSLPEGVGALYQSVANDIQGIGYEHIADLDAVIPEPYFDDTPNSQVQGFLHMNRWSQYLGEDAGGVDDTRISLFFGQEFGHAWLSFVHVQHPDLDPRALLGRSDAHWSFYLHSGGSPIQGHEWTDNGDGTFTATRQELYEFSDLDLYLMGLLPPEDVEPFFVIDDPTDCVDSEAGPTDCSSVNAFLFEGDSYTVSGTRRDVTVDDVIASEGARVPAWPDTPDTYDVSFLLIKRPGETLSDEELDAFEAVVERSIEIFDGQTRGLARIVNRTASDDPGSGEGSTGGEADTSGGADESTSGEPQGESSTGDAPASEGSDATGPGDPGIDDAESSDGCGCEVDPEPTPSLLLLGFGLVFARPRRRARTF